MKKLVFALFITILLTPVSSPQTDGDNALIQVLKADALARAADGSIPTLPASTHAYRAEIYMANRQFPQARSHWKKLIAVYPHDSGIPKALFGMGRSNMWERNYEKAVYWFDRVVREHPGSFEGREGLAYKGASFVRMGKNIEAANTYTKYAVMFPNGKRAASSYLNIIDAYREEGLYDKANLWVTRTSERFGNSKTETNALHARLRMEVYRANWRAAIKAADELLSRDNFKDSMAFEYEVIYIKAYAYEKLGQKRNAISIYSRIPVNATSYFGGLATDRIADLGGTAKYRRELMTRQSRRIAAQYPVRYRPELLRFAKSRGIDSRFVLAIMKQESSFRPGAKSPAAARGLLQLTYDTALKYNREAGFESISASDLYKPNVNIAIGSIYIKKLKDDFGGLYEAIAASYNGGEDNVARWLARSIPKERAIFASEVGFSETKRYVFKVMSNYRVYQELYSENLTTK